LQGFAAMTTELSQSDSTASHATEPVVAGQAWLTDLLKHLGASPSITPAPLAGFEQLDGLWLTIESAGLSPEQTQLLLGEKGQVLDAIQYLLNITYNINRAKDDHAVFTLELAGYRLKRLQELQALADQIAAQVRETHAEVEMPPLSAAERRLVHTLFKDISDLETFSRGQEPDRRLVVQPRSAASASQEP
jgi:spoIIIJ-associated protein